MSCNNCNDEGWVCEDHHNRPFDGNNNCCGGAGMPCPACNKSDYNNPPRMPPGMEVIWTRDKGFLN